MCKYIWPFSRHGLLLIEHCWVKMMYWLISQCKQSIFKCDLEERVIYTIPKELGLTRPYSDYKIWLKRLSLSHSSLSHSYLPMMGMIFFLLKSNRHIHVKVNKLKHACAKLLHKNITRQQKQKYKNRFQTIATDNAFSM